MEDWLAGICGIATIVGAMILFPIIGYVLGKLGDWLEDKSNKSIKEKKVSSSKTSISNFLLYMDGKGPFSYVDGSLGKTTDGKWNGWLKLKKNTAPPVSLITEVNHPFWVRTGDENISVVSTYISRYDDSVDYNVVYFQEVTPKQQQEKKEEKMETKECIIRYGSSTGLQIGDLQNLVSKESSDSLAKGWLKINKYNLPVLGSTIWIAANSKFPSFLAKIVQHNVPLEGHATAYFEEIPNEQKEQSPAPLEGVKKHDEDLENTIYYNNTFSVRNGSVSGPIYEKLDGSLVKKGDLFKGWFKVSATKDTKWIRKEWILGIESTTGSTTVNPAFLPFIAKVTEINTSGDTFTVSFEEAKIQNPVKTQISSGMVGSGKLFVSPPGDRPDPTYLLDLFPMSSIGETKPIDVPKYRYVFKRIDKSSVVNLPPDWYIIFSKWLKGEKLYLVLPYGWEMYKENLE